MSAYEVWSLIINSLIAIGTVGAVLVALWPKINEGKIKIKAIKVHKRDVLALTFADYTREAKKIDCLTLYAKSENQNAYINLSPYNS